MSSPTRPTPAKLVASIIFTADSSGKLRSTPELQKVLQDLEEIFGPLDQRSEIGQFTQTEYYNKEMGEGLLRQFVSFKGLVEREGLADIKRATNEIEEKYCRANGCRQVNIDPGLLSVENFVLATGKNFTHRIYLRDGIFAEVTLLYRDGRFQILPWTYWDYTSEEVIGMLKDLRQGLLEKLKAGGML